MLDKSLITGIAIFAVAVFGITVASAQQDYLIPEWIKNTAGWWSDGAVSDSEFVDALQFLIDEEVLQIQKNNKNKKTPKSRFTNYR